jgi:hypothetical protein
VLNSGRDAAPLQFFDEGLRAAHSRCASQRPALSLGQPGDQDRDVARYETWSNTGSSHGDSLGGRSAVHGCLVCTGFRSGNDLHTASNLAMQTYCVAYVAGVLDALNDSSDDDWACVPSATRVPQLVGLVRKYLEEHPERRRVSATDVIRSALGQAFPCPEK